ncbi:MAG: NADPH:quinone reductase [Chloroflexi bacterium]|nr:NADPH:quinone reductase [Chloroflexota bacterium]|tara:strand:+ start:10154 stop:11122 length:969 start_codon:yes stop_codon:yes gene_type:complete
MKAIKITNFGDSSVLKYTDVDTPKPSNNEIIIKQEAIGVNFIDIYQRSGVYQVDLPFIPGEEGAGIVTQIGKNVSRFKVGDKVAYSMNSGSYAEYAVVSEEIAVSIPDKIDFPIAASVLLQGMTAHYLVYSTFKLKPEDSCLIHAGAGGVGLLLIQMAKNIGARIIATVSNEEKKQLAINAGADEVIIYTKQNFTEEVKKITSNKGVSVVYDSVGKTTFEDSLDCLKPRGYMVLYGQSSGAVPPVDPQILNRKGSLFLTRPTMTNYILNNDELKWRSNDIFQWMSEGKLNIRIGLSLPLQQAAQAQDALGSRKTTGKVILIP